MGDTEDMRIMAESIDRIRSENAALRKMLRSRTILQAFAGISMLASVVALLFVGGCWVFSSPQVDHCYLSADGWSMAGDTRLMASVDWGLDRKVAEFDSVKEAIEAVKILKCPMAKMGR